MFLSSSTYLVALVACASLVIFCQIQSSEAKVQGQNSIKIKVASNPHAPSPKLRVTTTELDKSTGNVIASKLKTVRCGHRSKLVYPWYWNSKGQKCKRLEDGKEFCRTEIAIPVHCTDQ